LWGGKRGTNLLGRGGVRTGAKVGGAPQKARVSGLLGKEGGGDQQSSWGNDDSCPQADVKKGELDIRATEFRKGGKCWTRKGGGGPLPIKGKTKVTQKKKRKTGKKKKTDCCTKEIKRGGGSREKNPERLSGVRSQRPKSVLKNRNGRKRKKTTGSGKGEVDCRQRGQRHNNRGKRGLQGQPEEKKEQGDRGEKKLKKKTTQKKKKGGKKKKKNRKVAAGRVGGRECTTEKPTHHPPERQTGGKYQKSEEGGGGGGGRG